MTHQVAIWILGSHCLCLDWITKWLISDVGVTAACPAACQWVARGGPRGRRDAHATVAFWGVSVTPWKVNHRAECGQDAGL